jgi:hypothetical protein
MSNVIPFNAKKPVSFKPFIFIDTLFVHQKESFFVMGLCEHQRTIQISEDTLAASEDLQKQIICEMLKVHYKASHGKLSIWGDVHYYKYFSHPERALVFDVNGNFLYESKEVLPERAVAKMSGDTEYEIR